MADLDASSPWVMRITGRALVDPQTLTPHPDNPKIHGPEQDVVVEASLRDLGWLKSLTVNTITGNLLDGHERLALAIQAGSPLVPVEYVELPEADEPKALLILDPSGSLYRTHLERWAMLAQQVQSGEAALQQFLSDMAQNHGLFPDAPPSLDDLEEHYGEPDDQAFWKTISLKVPPETWEQYTQLMAGMTGSSEAERFAALLALVAA